MKWLASPERLQSCLRLAIYSRNKWRCSNEICQVIEIICLIVVWCRHDARD